MKKQILIASVAILTSLATTTGIIITSNTNAQTSTSDNTVTFVNESPLSLINSKNETVYVIANSNGSKNKTFIGSSPYTDGQALPFEISITYYLDNAEISANELAGKSGHVKIVTSYTATATYENKNIPFLAVSSTMLDGAKFKNITIDNGKIISEDKSIAVVGYATVGLNEDLGVDFLPDSFTIEADATNFELGTIYTVLMNDIIGDLDTSKLSSIDSLVNSVNQLSAGLDQIISGSSELSSGLQTLIAKSTELKSGIEQLDTGLKTLIENNATLKSGATNVFNNLLKQTNDTIDANQELLAAINHYEISYPLTIENYAESITGIIQILTAQKAAATEPVQIATLEGTIAKLSAAKTSYDNYATFYYGLYNYVNGVASASAGASEIAKNMPALIAGETELYNGSIKLTEGLNTFKTTGVDKLVNFANNNLANFTYNARKTIEAARSYKHYVNQNAESVKFIVKTPSIK